MRSKLSDEHLERRSSLVRIAAALAIALLLGALIVRNAMVQAFVAGEPQRAAEVWPNHPSVVLEEGLVEIGTVAASGRPVDPQLVQRLINSYREAPLAPEPFLVRGVEGQLAGNALLAGRSFLAARDRDPRELGARYFLANHYLELGETDPGLAEISALIRMVPQSVRGIAPYLAAYARRPEGRPKVKALLAQQPQLESEMLNQLSADPANLDLILETWSGRGGPETQHWQARLVNQLVSTARFDEARDAWIRFTGISPQPDQLFDKEFTVAAQPPFGWTLVSGPSGVAEPRGGGRLHIIYYGRDDLALASQMLTLRPGRFRFSMKGGGSAKAGRWLSWVVRCLPSKGEIASIPLARPNKDGLIEGTITIPSGGCGAQSLALEARAPDVPEQVELTIGDLNLQRETGA